MMLIILTVQYIVLCTLYVKNIAHFCVTIYSYLHYHFIIQIETVPLRSNTTFLWALVW